MWHGGRKFNDGVEWKYPIEWILGLVRNAGGVERV